MRADLGISGKPRDCARKDASKLPPVNAVMQSGQAQPAMGVERTEPRVDVATTGAQPRPLRDNGIELLDEAVKRG